MTTWWPLVRLIGSFFVYIGFLRTRFEVPGRPLGLHCVPFVSLWGALGSLWDALGRHWDAFGHTLGHLGLHWGVLGMPWDHFGTPWARCWHVWGSFWDILELWCPQEPPSQADGSQVPRLRTKTDPLELASWSSRSLRNGTRTALRTYLPHAPGIRMT